MRNFFDGDETKFTKKRAEMVLFCFFYFVFVCFKEINSKGNYRAKLID